jgi:hypothetical protein
MKSFLSRFGAAARLGSGGLPDQWLPQSRPPGHLWGIPKDDPERRRQSTKFTRWLAILQAHGLILKVQKTHRYQLTANGRRIAMKLLSAHAANALQFAAAA